MPDLTPALVRVDSAEEQYAYMLAWFGDPTGWAVTSQMFDVAADGRDVEHVDIQPIAGALVRVTFVSAREDAFFDAPVVDEDGTQFLDRVMEAASSFSTENPPHHPGTVARFPVPSASYANALALPMPVVAVESGRRGLYAPPRVVVIDNSTGEAKGVGEFPGFDPEHWPPPRLGDWPPPAIAAMHRLQLQGSIMRFSALWNRVLRAWFSKDIMDSPDLTSDVQEALAMRATLDLPALLPYYDRLNPVFAKWLARRAESG